MEGVAHAYLDDIGYTLKDLGGDFRLGVGGLEAQFEDLVTCIDEEVFAETVLRSENFLRSLIFQGMESGWSEGSKRKERRDLIPYLMYDTRWFLRNGRVEDDPPLPRVRWSILTVLEAVI